MTDIVQKSSALLSEGIPLTAHPPEYRYAQLAKIRPDLLAEASRDAKTRGQRLVAVAGGRLGRLQSVSAGVFQITAPNATDTSGEGVYDTSTIEKDVTAVSDSPSACAETPGLRHVTSRRPPSTKSRRPPTTPAPGGHPPRHPATPSPIAGSVAVIGGTTSSLPSCFPLQR